MNVNLKIENDAELRQHIKGLISGQVKSIVREDIKDILKEVLGKKIKDTDIPTVDFLVKQEINQMVKKELDAKGWNEPSFIKTEARKFVNEYIKEAFAKQNIIS